MKKMFLLPGLLLVLCNCFPVTAQVDFYQLKTYHISNSQQEIALDSFLGKVCLPAMHRTGIAKVGVFKPVKSDTARFGKLVFVLIPFRSLGEFEQLEAKLQQDKNYSGSPYYTAAYSNPAYSRIESTLLKAFSGMTHYTMPKLNGPVADRIYELRSYESATERLYVNKVDMFNRGDEIGLFRELNFNAVFYAEVVSGGHMPNLMYMTSFDNIASREAHWKAFVDHPHWKKLSSSPEYQNNVSKADIWLLSPTGYSEF